MALLEKSKLRRSFGIRDENLMAIKLFMQGSVYCWVKNKKGDVFAARDLVGGDNFNWKGTPLQVLYEKHICKGKNHEDAIEEAGKDLGWILKLVLNEDKRTFSSHNAGKAKGYKWIEN